MTGKELQEELTWKFPHIAKEAPEQVEEAAAFCEGYKAFLDEGKTERECVKKAVELLKAAGYAEFDTQGSYQPGDKVYYVNRNKAIIATTFGEKSVKEGIRMNGAHIDSPRLDLKPSPVYEKDDMALFKTHYYGGIRKYQWATIPLAMHGVIIKKNGEMVELNLGEKPGDPVFCITDLLPHLSAEQNERKLKDGIKGEELNIVIGSIPYTDDEVKEPVKLMALKLMNEQFGITEKDFLRAEVEFVPAHKASDVGFDRSMVGAYGQDDRICAYTALMAEIDTKNPTYTTMTILTDKEEIGSEGVSGMKSAAFDTFMNDLCESQNVALRVCYENAFCLSADVCNAFDPNYPEVSEKRNDARANCGFALVKYTGARGKSGTSDATAELMARIRCIFDKAGIIWQTGQLGKVDQGGGGTVAMYLANRNIDTVDAGVPVLSMHAPFECIAKLDLYMAYKGFGAFYKD